MKSLSQKVGVLTMVLLGAVAHADEQPKLAFGARERGPGSSAGGDKCQDRIEAIRNDISEWIQKGGSTALKLPSEITLEKYNGKMQQIINKTRLDHQESISCTDDPKLVMVGKAPKTCISYFEVDGRPRILCYRGQLEGDQFKNGFMGQSADDQYFTIHHELAVLSGLEDQSGDPGNYQISDQITGYLENQIVRKLAVRQAIHSATLTCRQKDVSESTATDIESLVVTASLTSVSFRCTIPAHDPRFTENIALHKALIAASPALKDYIRMDHSYEVYLEALYTDPSSEIKYCAPFSLERVVGHCDAFGRPQEGRATTIVVSDKTENRPSLSLQLNGAIFVVKRVIEEAGPGYLNFSSVQYQFGGQVMISGPGRPLYIAGDNGSGDAKVSFDEDYCKIERN